MDTSKKKKNSFSNSTSQRKTSTKKKKKKKKPNLQLDETKTHFGGLREKYLSPITFFSSPSPNQTPPKNNFSPLFSTKFSILSKFTPNKLL